MRQSRVAAVVSVAASLLGCSLVVGTSNLSGGNDGSDDAATDVDGGFGDAADLDGPGAVDSSAPVDAVASDAAPEPCPAGAFCDSFERLDVLGDWDTVTTDGPCSSTTDDSVAAAGMRSLRIDAPAVASGPCQRQHLRRFLGVADKIRLSFAIRSSPDLDRIVNVAAVSVASWSRFFVLGLGSGDAFQIEEQDPAQKIYVGRSLGTLAPLVWHRVAVEVDISSRRMRVEVDGARRLDRTMDLDFSASERVLSVGVTYSTPGAATSLWLDDVRFAADL